MAEPIIADHFKVQAVFQGDSGLAEDRFVNTWYFRNDSVEPFDDFFTSVTTQLAAFYGDVPSGTSRSIGSFMPRYLNDGLELRFYDLADQPPREPEVRVIDDWSPSSDLGGLPSEVALCLSFYGDRNLPRQRGRVFLGPFIKGAADGPRGKPATLLLESVRRSAIDMLSIGQATWVQLSRAAANTNVVTAGWVDNAFDTQRRRGEEADQRLVFPIP